MDHFLILAPSTVAELPSSLGNTFLIQSGLTEPDGDRALLLRCVNV